MGVGGVSLKPRPPTTPGKDPVPILDEGGWAPGPVWTGGISIPHLDSIPDLAVRSPFAIPTELSGRVDMSSFYISPSNCRSFV